MEAYKQNIQLSRIKLNITSISTIFSLDKYVHTWCKQSLLNQLVNKEKHKSIFINHSMTYLFKHKMKMYPMSAGPVNIDGTHTVSSLRLQIFWFLK